jgi:hypothetical protein
MAIATDRVAILLPLGVGVTMTFCTVIVQAVFMMPIIHFVRFELRLGRAGVHFWKDIWIIAGAALVALTAHMLAIAFWALVFSFCGEFSQLSRAFYHSGMNYTTLGDSDTVMSPPWRLMAPLEGANGMLMFGLSTAVLLAIIQRLIQTRLNHSRSDGIDERRRAS